MSQTEKQQKLDRLTDTIAETEYQIRLDREILNGYTAHDDLKTKEQLLKNLSEGIEHNESILQALIKQKNKLETPPPLMSRGSEFVKKLTRYGSSRGGKLRKSKTYRKKKSKTYRKRKSKTYRKRKSKTYKKY